MQSLAKLIISGSRETGKDVRTQNVVAVSAIANIVKSSLGPEGLDKMLVDEIGDVLITNDGATILKRLDVEHPAAKVLVDLAQMQDQEIGDGTTSVVILAAEFLKRGNELIKQKLHPTSIISGYRLASKQACKYITEHLSVSVESLGPETLINAAMTSMSSKIIGAEKEFFSKLCVDALLRVKNKAGKYPLSAINVLKCQGQSMTESVLVPGYALNCTVGSQAMPKQIIGAKIACIDFNLNKMKLHHGVKLTLTDPTQINAIQQREMDITKERVQMILNAGANVILTSKGIDSTSMKYFVEAGVMAVRRVTKHDLRQIAKATGATILLNLANLDGGESFDPSYLGEANEVSQEPVSDKEMIFVRDCKNEKTSSIILRGPHEYMLDEMERSVHDVLCIIKRTLEHDRVVPGGGAVEAALSIYLETFANTLGSREQLAIAQFAEALLVIPKTLAVNAAKDATDLVAKLRAHHNASQTLEDEASKKLAGSGLDLRAGKIRNNLEAGVIEPAISKIKSLQFATEAAITILRIDDLITLDPEPPREDPHGE
eukprot:TRINITY_DN2413_c0_g1_i1.p1 TRINITY_DN2413_c0_g1~~TRINITY_DN2413_c0_g1_i1.p1  ORF type:complete len:546 (-),score=306.76 TRINITY_DN2413_c0_g1_i1:196-1833(-)